MCHPSTTPHGNHCPFLWSIPLKLSAENECFWLLFFAAPKFLDVEVPSLLLCLLLFCKGPITSTLILHLPDLRWWPLQPEFLLRSQWKGLTIFCTALSGIICGIMYYHPKICLLQSKKMKIPALQVQTSSCSVALAFSLNQTRLHSHRNHCSLRSRLRVF